MILHPPNPTRTDPLSPYTTLCLSRAGHDELEDAHPGVAALARAATTSSSETWSNRRYHSPTAKNGSGAARTTMSSASFLSRPRAAPGAMGTAKIGRAHVELQSLMRISYAVLCLKKKKRKT